MTDEGYANWTSVVTFELTLCLEILKQLSMALKTKDFFKEKFL